MQDDLVEFQNLKRLISEQIILTDNEIQLEISKNISTNSLQNPSDSDASYRYKAGKSHIGYVGNFVETIDEHGAIITQYDYRILFSKEHCENCPNRNKCKAKIQKKMLW